MQKTLLLTIILFLSGLLNAQQNPDEMAIKLVLDKQIMAWNKTDISAFMEGYWKSDQMAFVGSTGPQFGWQNTYDRYVRTYDSPDKMGVLAFEVLKMESMGNTHYLVLGKWYLTRKTGDIGGHFTLIFKKINGEWKIIYDHTS